MNKNAPMVPATRFLSRYDKSATNIKDAELFIAAGQVPWAIPQATWYHEYPVYPIDAITAAATLGEYTITDRGTWLSVPTDVISKLTLFNRGQDDPNQDTPEAREAPADRLLNPAFFLLGTRGCQQNIDVGNEFLDWVVSADGQKVIAEFEGTIGGGERLYTRAPTRTDLAIKGCNATVTA
ncbi:hypothetical protein HDV00_009581 [Rhizophlyctis rosea]|nr:hypothetical protein HDV00_009581 [Rhizophlyctis rosea]